MKQKTFLIVGASGVVGSEIVRNLKSQGHRVRTTTGKKTASPDQVHLNLQTGEGIKQAFQGIDRVFILSPMGLGDQYAVLSPLIQEAKRQGLEKVVLMTADGVEANEQSPFRRAEIDLEKSGLGYNIIRPNWFMQNFVNLWGAGIREQNLLAIPAGQGKGAWIDSRDISDVAARLLTTDEIGDGAFNLTGSEASTAADVAAEISQVLGRTIRYESADPVAFRAQLISHGVPADYADVLMTVFGFLRDGYQGRTTDSVEKILGRKPRTLKNFVREYQASWKS